MIQNTQIHFTANVQVINGVARIRIPDEYAFLNNKRVRFDILMMDESEKSLFTDKYIKENWNEIITDIKNKQSTTPIPNLDCP
jgi:hypothetical protein